MRLLSNPEWKEFLKGYGVITLLWIVGGFLKGPDTGIYVMGVCGLLLVFFWHYTKKRHKALSALSVRLNEILHGEEHLDFVPDEEGELSVLSGEIYKLTIQLREQAELLQKEKSYLKDALADISHQIKTPLTTLRLIFAREREADCRQEAKNLLSRIEWLLEVLLKTAKLESGTINFSQSKISIKELFRKVLEPLEILMELRGVKLVLPREDAFYTGDFYWSVEAFGNLLKNCLEHTKEGEEIVVSTEENPWYTMIVIQDSGTGFSETDVPHLFERFYQGKNVTTSGVGIGLSLAKQIIQRQNGTIQAFNQPEGGAEFQIRIYKSYPM